MLNLIYATAFWLSGALLFFTFVGYRYFISLLARTWPHSEAGPNGKPAPSVTVVLVAHNEEDRIAARIENLLSADYPPELLSVLLVSDGSTDRTVEKAGQLGSTRVEIVALPERRGKAHGLNTALARCTSDVVVFADARQRFAPDTIRRLATRLKDPEVGAVSGALEIDQAQSGVGQAIDSYWRWEKAIRADESRYDSCIGCTGAVYAIRRRLFSPIPPDTILDDVVIPMQVSMQGYRVLHEPEALAFDPQPLEPSRERVRKKRTLAGNFQMLCRYPGWLFPWRNRLWWQLLAHKYLRILAPAFLVIAFASSALLYPHLFYRAALLAQSAFYLLAALGLAIPTLKAKPFAFPAGFVFLNTTTIQAFLEYLRRSDLHRWSTQRR